MQNEYKQLNTIVIGIDVGSLKSGIVILKNGQIILAQTSPNEEIVDLIRSYYRVGVKMRVAIESVAAYKARISPQIIETCKWIGKFEDRLKTARIAFKLIPRSTVKTWVFHAHHELLSSLIAAKIIKAAQNGDGRKLFKKNGQLIGGSPVWVDDAMIIAAMRERYSIPVPKPFQKSEVSSHSWQALALAACYFDTYISKKRTTLQIYEYESN